MFITHNSYYVKILLLDLLRQTINYLTIMKTVITCCTWMVGKVFVNQLLNTLTNEYFFEVEYPDGVVLPCKRRAIAFRWASKF